MPDSGVQKSRGCLSMQIFNRCLLILVSTALLGGCITQPKVEFYLTNIAPLPSTLFEQRVRLDLRVQNLDERPLRASGADVALLVNGSRLARGVSNQEIELEALSDTTTSVVVSSSVFDSVRQLLGLPGREVFTYELRGKLFSPGLNRRFQRSGEFTREELNRLIAPKN